jgi:hypothetical protein
LYTTTEKVTKSYIPWPTSLILWPVSRIYPGPPHWYSDLLVVYKPAPPSFKCCCPFTCFYIVIKYTNYITGKKSIVIYGEPCNVLSGWKCLDQKGLWPIDHIIGPSFIQEKIWKKLFSPDISLKPLNWFLWT